MREREKGEKESESEKERKKKRKRQNEEKWDSKKNEAKIMRGKVQEQRDRNPAQKSKAINFSSKRKYHS